jgi:cysteine desulfurase
MNTIYLDNNATTRVDPAVVEAMQPFLLQRWGNPSSMHAFGGAVQKALDQARLQVAALIGAAEPTEIIFTSCGTESDNTAIWSALQAQPEKKHLITTRVEHPAVRSLAHHLKRQGYAVTEIPVDGQGMLDPNAVERAITTDTALITIMWANNETGGVLPIREIGKIARKHGVLFHTDAVQAVGKIPLDLKQTPVDMLSLSGHKLHAPKGVGALYIRKGAPYRPFIRGGHQEGGRRGGTEAVHQIVALGAAAALAAANTDDENTRIARLRDKLEQGILNTIPDVRLNGHPTKRLPNTTNLSFAFVEGEGILLLLSDAGIAASSGSACTSGTLEPSHVLRAMGVPYTYAHGSIRFSLSRFNTEAEIDAVLEHVPRVIARLRKISPFYKK